MAEQVKVGDAIVSRANAPLVSTCLALLRKGVPARIEGRDVGKQLSSMVRAMKARSVPDFIRRLEAWAAKQKKRVDVGKNGPARAAQVDDMRDTLAALAEGCANVSEVLARIKSLFSNSDDEGVRPSVVLSTVHKFKGLEADNVFVLAWTMNQKRRGMTDEQHREEENIYYVACTRAKKRLVLVSQGGSKLAVQPDGSRSGSI